MATVAISALPAATGVAGADVTPIVQSATTKKVTFSAIFAAPPAIGGTTPDAASFTTLSASGNFAVATNKFTIAAASGNTLVAGTLTVGSTTLVTGAIALAGTTPAVQTGYNLTIGDATASTNSAISLNGATTANFGPGLAFRRGGTAKAFVGTESWVTSGASDDFVISSVASTSIRIRANGSATNGLVIDTSNNVSLTGTLNIAGTAASTTASQIQLGASTQSTIGANGAASALTANPLGYLVAYLGTTKIVIPYYNA